MKRFTHIRLSGALLCTATLWLACLAMSSLTMSCETEMAPVLDGIEPPVHVVTGYLDAGRDSQFVRVQRVRRTAKPRPAMPDEFAVTTSGAGNTVVWQDSIVVLDDGSTAHLYVGAFRPKVGTTYTLTIRENEITTTYKTEIPARPTVEVGTPTRAPPLGVNVLVLGLSARPPDLAVAYDVTNPEDGQRRVLVYQYNPIGRWEPNGWAFFVQLGTDRSKISSDLGRPDTPLVLHSATVEFSLAGDQWVGTDKSFFASKGFYVIPLTLDAATRIALGFQP